MDRSARPLLQMLKVASELPLTFRALEGGVSKVKVKERSKAKARLQTSPYVALLKVQSLELAGDKAGPGPGVRVGRLQRDPRVPTQMPAGVRQPSS